MYDLSDNFGYALGVTQQGESNIKDNNSALVLPGYSRIDFVAFYNLSSDVTVRLNVENLTDKLYFPHSHSTHQASVGEPLNARLSITKSSNSGARGSEESPFKVKEVETSPFLY